MASISVRYVVPTQFLNLAPITPIFRGRGLIWPPHPRGLKEPKKAGPNRVKTFRWLCLDKIAINIYCNFLYKSFFFLNSRPILGNFSFFCRLLLFTPAQERWDQYHMKKRWLRQGHEPTCLEWSSRSLMDWQLNRSSSRFILPNLPRHLTRGVWYAKILINTIFYWHFSESLFSNINLHSQLWYDEYMLRLW